MSIVKVNDIEMYYEIHGQGGPLVMLHGITESSRTWNQFIPDFQDHFQLYHFQPKNPS